MRLETTRMYLYPISDEQIKEIIEKEEDPEMKKAYGEMLAGCEANPSLRVWYTVWNMELKDEPGTIVGDFCFKGVGEDGTVEIGYGLKESYYHKGYMTEAVQTVTLWALSQDNVKRVEAETDPTNTASQRVLTRCGFVPNGIMGEEGPRFEYKGSKEC